MGGLQDADAENDSDSLDEKPWAEYLSSEMDTEQSLPVRSEMNLEISASNFEAEISFTEVGIAFPVENKKVSKIR